MTFLNGLTVTRSSIFLLLVVMIPSPLFSAAIQDGDIHLFASNNYQVVISTNSQLHQTLVNIDQNGQRTVQTMFIIIGILSVFITIFAGLTLRHFFIGYIILTILTAQNNAQQYTNAGWYLAESEYTGDPDIFNLPTNHPMYNQQPNELFFPDPIGTQAPPLPQGMVGNFVNGVYQPSLQRWYYDTFNADYTSYAAIWTWDLYLASYASYTNYTAIAPPLSVISFTEYAHYMSVMVLTLIAVVSTVIVLLYAVYVLTKLFRNT